MSNQDNRRGVFIPTSEEVEESVTGGRGDRRERRRGDKAGFRGKVRRAFKLRDGAGRGRTEVSAPPANRLRTEEPSAPEPSEADPWADAHESRAAQPETVAEPISATDKKQQPDHAVSAKPTSENKKSGVRIKSVPRREAEQKAKQRQEVQLTADDVAAIARAKQFGHEITGPFEWLSHVHERRTAACIRCGGKVMITLERESGSRTISGDGMRKRCTG